MSILTVTGTQERFVSEVELAEKYQADLEAFSGQAAIHRMVAPRNM